MGAARSKDEEGHGRLQKEDSKEQESRNLEGRSSYH